MPALQENAQIIERICTYCQAVISEKPTIVVGSGASAAFGLPTMSELGNFLVEQLDLTPITEAHKEKWNHFKHILPVQGLEAAVDQSDMWREKDLYEAVRSKTWLCIQKSENERLLELMKNNSSLPMTELLGRLFTTTNRCVTVITTNYDRLCETAATLGGYMVRNGFNPGHFGKWRSDNVPLTHTQGNSGRAEYTVDLIKVHGSLDWFLHEKHGIYQRQMYPDNPLLGVPLIVPPSLRKYADVSTEPFRTMIANADVALQRSNSFLCIGYGFNDEHIQLKLIDRAAKYRKRVLILTRTATPRMKEIFLTRKDIDYCILERHDSGGTNVISSFLPSEARLLDAEIWSLENFLMNAV